MSHVWVGLRALTGQGAGWGLPYTGGKGVLHQKRLFPMETPLPFLGKVCTPTPVMVSARPPHTLKPGPGEAGAGSMGTGAHCSLTGEGARKMAAWWAGGGGSAQRAKGALGDQPAWGYRSPRSLGGGQ